MGSSNDCDGKCLNFSPTNRLHRTPRLRPCSNPGVVGAGSVSRIVRPRNRSMQNRKRNEWIWPPADQWIAVWGLWIIAIIAIVTTQLLTFFSSFTGTRWIWCYVGALIIGGVGASLIFFAKLPLYRERRFFTFGSRALPEQRRPFYRWGYCCVAFAIALLVCLLLSRP